MNSRILLFAVATCLPVAAYSDEKSLGSPSRDRPSSNLILTKSTVEPANQGISPSDLMTTRDINQEIAQFKFFSPQVRDVRVATYKGRVTLRGTAISAEEKHQLEKIAREISGSDTVVNEIEIRTGIARN